LKFCLNKRSRINMNKILTFQYPNQNERAVAKANAEANRVVRAVAESSTSSRTGQSSLGSVHLL